MNQRRLTSEQAEGHLADLLPINFIYVPPDTQIITRSWDIATILGQSDTFGALGYAAAKAYNGEFWTSDARFANAAARRGLTRLRLIP